MNADTYGGIPIGEFTPERGATRDVDFDPSPDPRTDLRKDQPVGEFPGGRGRFLAAENLLLVAVSDAESPAINKVPGKCFDLLIDLGMNFFVNARYCNQDCRAHFEQGTRELLDKRTISQGHAMIEHSKIHVARRYM